MDKPPGKAPDAFRTISEVAQDLDLPQHVLRFWETRFAQIKPMKRGGGRRYYRPEDVDLLRGIRLLLYAEGFTIRGVQRLLKENGIGFVAAVGQSGSVQGAKAAPRPAEDDEPDFEPPEDEPPREAPEPRVETPPATPEPMPAPPMPALTAQRHPDAVRPAAADAISREGRRRIEAALADLLEAKRLLDSVR